MNQNPHLATLLPIVQKLITMLRQENNPVKQQITLELLTAEFCLGAGDWADQVAQSIHKHVNSLLRTHSEMLARTVQMGFDFAEEEVVVDEEGFSSGNGSNKT